MTIVCKMKKVNRPKMELLMLSKPYVTKTRFNYSFNSLRNEILNQLVRNHLISTSEVICLINLCYPLKEGNLVITNTFFLPGITSLFHFLLPIKVFQFVQFLEAPFYLLDWMLPNSNLFLLN